LRTDEGRLTERTTEGLYPNTLSPSPLTLIVIADPTAPFLKALSRLPKEATTIVSNHETELIKHASEADAILYAHHQGSLLRSILPLARRLCWIHSLWTGVEGILVPELVAHPAPLTNGRGVFSGPLADWAMAAILHFAFDLRRVIAQQEQGVWRLVHGTSVCGRTLGIVGFGAIGAAAARRAKVFGMRIAALRRSPELSPPDDLLDAVYGPDRLLDLMAASDYVLASAPLTPATRGLIGDKAIGAMKSTAVIVNVGRGPVIEEPALIQALQSRQIRGAALDVFATEPLPAGHPFWSMSNVLLSPHTADRVEGFLDPAFDCFFENLERFQKREPLLNLVDKHAGY
jgi:phosphoglycerate dehydrogenase-like enzyme